MLNISRCNIMTIRIFYSHVNFYRSRKLHTASNRLLLSLLTADFVLLVNCYPMVYQNLKGSPILGVYSKIVDLVMNEYIYSYDRNIHFSAISYLVSVNWSSQIIATKCPWRLPNIRFHCHNCCAGRNLVSCCCKLW